MCVSGSGGRVVVFQDLFNFQCSHCPKLCESHQGELWPGVTVSSSTFQPWNDWMILENLVEQTSLSCMFQRRLQRGPGVACRNVPDVGLL